MDNTLPPPPSRTYALLIGVNDYSTFDPKNCHDLRGSCNDVLLLASYCMQVLGIPPANIRMLTAPAITGEHLAAQREIPGIADLSLENIGLATEAEARAQLTWLLEASRDGAALLAFSGHGTWSQNAGPQLCLSDTNPDFTEGVLPLLEISREVAREGAKDRLIAVFDCCHVAAPTAHHGRLQGKSLPHEGSPSDVAKDEDQFDVSSRVVLGAKPGKEAYQVLLGGSWHGALTFALTTAAERWRSTNEMSNGSYKHVLRRAKHTLKALGVRQKPSLRSPEARWGGIRRQPFMGVAEGPTVPKPDAEEDGVQLDGGYRYWFQAQDVSGARFDLAVVIAVGSTSTPITLGTTNTAWPTTGTNAGKECWYVNTHNIQSLSSGNYSIVVTKTVISTTESVPAMATSGSPSGFSGAGGLLTSSAPYIQASETTVAGWSQTPPSPIGTLAYFKGTPGRNPNDLWMGWDLSSGVLNQVFWYVITTVQPTTVQPTSYTPFAYQSSAPAGTYYQNQSRNNV